MVLNSRYLQHVLTLLSSAVAAQLLALLLMPILTRLYSPEAFGIFNAFVSYSGTFALFLFVSVELAIVRPKSLGGVNRVLGLLGFIVAITASIIFFTILLELELYSYIGFDKLFQVKFFVIFGTIFAAMNIVLMHMITRIELFSVYAKTQVAFVLTRFIFTLGLFYLGFTNNGLLIGFLIPTIINILYLAHKVNISSYRPNLNWQSIKATSTKYKDLIIYNTPASVISSIIVNFPIFFILKNYGIEMAGLFGLAYRMVLLPISSVNKAVGQILYKKLIDKRNDARYILWFIVKNISLLSTALPFFLLLYIFGEDIFGFVFGEQWRRSGSIASLMSPYIFLNFVISPMTVYFVAFDKNKLFSVVNALFLCLLIIIVNFQDFLSINDFIITYTLANIFYNIVLLLFIIYGVFKERGQNKETFNAAN